MVEKEFYKVVGKIDDILARSQTAAELFELIEEDIAYENYFFKKVKDLKWFSLLNERKYFSPDKALGVEKGEEKGFYRIPEWNILPYLEKVSGQVREGKNKEYVDELLEIIRDVTNYHLKHDKILDNYRTWWYFVKILLNIPSDRISIDIIDLIPAWLDSKFNASPQGSDIATKLLPKFLDSNNSDDWKKAEKIVDIITDIKWLPLPKQKTSLWEKKEEAKTVVDAYWLLESFKNKNNAVKVGEKCSEKIIFTLANRLKEIFRREEKTNYIDVNFNHQKYHIIAEQLEDYRYCIKIGIQNIPAGDIFEEQLAKVTKKYFKELFNFKLKNCNEEVDFVKRIKEELKKEKNEIFANLKNEFDEHLTGLYEGIHSDYSYIWFESLYSLPKVGLNEAKEVLILILRDILLAKSRKDKDATEKALNKFLTYEYQYPLFRRIVLFIIGNEWNRYKNLFWKMVDEDSKNLLFDDSDYELEVKKLLKNNIKSFTPEEKEKIKAIIQKGPQQYLPEKNQKRYVSYWKQKWYWTVKSDSYFYSFYKKYEEITKIKKEEKVWSERLTGWVGPGPSPLTKEDILRRSNEELVEYLNSFKTKDEWEGPTVGGLAGVLKETVVENPSKFTKKLEPFLDVGYRYVYEIIDGLRDAWSKNKEVEWKETLKFIEGYLKKDGFWDDKFKVETDNWKMDHKGVIKIIGDFISEGTQKDEHALPDDCIRLAKKIIFTALNKEKEEAKKFKGEGYVTHTLNSVFGRVIVALIHLTLHIARIDKEKEQKEIHWDRDIKEQYENLFKKEIVESYVIFGQYMGNFYYLDKNWVKERIKKFENKEFPDSLWEPFMKGYLFYSSLYKNIYGLMKGHYLRAIACDFKDKEIGSIGDRLVQHISLSYLIGNENVKDKESLFRKLLDKWDHSQIKEMIGYFWMQRNYLVETVKDKVKIEENSMIKERKERTINFWRWIYENKYKNLKDGKLTADDKELLSEISKLTIFLSRIDEENSKWLILSASSLEGVRPHPASFFLEYLNRFNDKESISYIGKILLALLSKSTITYREEDIKSLVEKIYKYGKKTEANEICNTYGTRGIDFLRDTYEKYNKEK